MTAVEVALTRRLHNYADKLVANGGKELSKQVGKNKATPKDTGALAKGVQTYGSTTSIIVQSTTRNNGFDYPAFLDKVTYIRPTRAKFLHFFYRGREVFSKGFPNRHTGWWAKVVNQAEWSKALATAHKRISRW